MIQVIESLETWREIRALSTFNEKRIGFVPTMGALHEGHLSLLKRARRECDFVISSIFVNPTQFNDQNDFQKYPRTLEKDVDLLNLAQTDFLLAPEYASMYPDEYRYNVTENDFSLKLCGAHRPGHFNGVLTVVLKLLNLVRADRAYFGEKDFQQLELIRGMCSAFFLPTEIIGCPTVREHDGLAMSSRNVRLSPEGRKRAPEFARALEKKVSPSEIQQHLENLGFKVDYIEEINGRRYGAVFLDGVRLIDNVKI